MQAIITKYMPNSNSIKAKCAAGSITVPFHYGETCAHNAAVIALLKKLGWNCSFVSGELPDGTRCHVLIPVKVAKTAKQF